MPNLAGNVSFEQVNIGSATLPGDTTLNLISLGTNTTNFYYDFPNGFNVALDATLAVGANVLVEIPGGQTLTDNGAVSFATGDTFSFVGNDAQISVGGTLSATSTIFNGYDSSNISVSSGGNLTPTNCTFNLPITVPYNVVPNLAGNVSFEQVNIGSATLPGDTTLNLISLGTNTTNFYYDFSNGFNVALDATLAVGANVLVEIPGGQTLTDNGAVSFATGDTFSFVGNGAQISVGGTLSATSTIFNGYDSSNISVSSGGNLTPTNCTFNLPIFVPYNVVPNLAGNVSFNQVEIDSGIIPSGTTLNLDLIGTNNTNLSYVFPSGFNVAAGGTVAVGNYVPVAISSSQAFMDNGALSFTIGDTLTFPGGGTIAVGGALTASSTTFTGGMLSRISRSTQVACFRSRVALIAGSV